MNKYPLLVLLPTLAVALSGQSSCEPDDGFAWAPPGADYAAAGPQSVSSSVGSMAAPSGCTLAYTNYTAAVPVEAPLVVLSHGFQRNMTHMADLAAHLASYGLHVVTPDLCHSVPLDNDIEGDAADMIALATEFGARRVIYMGHSAGGMRSIVAGSQDPRTVTIIGLDAVDALDAALDAAPGLTVPLHGIVGEPSACNAANNGIPVYESAPDVIALRVTEADHCDFEGPTDALCTSFCQGSNAQFDDDTISKAVWSLATSATLWRGGVDGRAADWWVAGGDSYAWLESNGLAATLVR